MQTTVIDQNSHDSWSHHLLASGFFGLAFVIYLVPVRCTNHQLRLGALFQHCTSRPPTPFHSGNCYVVVLSELLLAVIAL